MSRGQERQNLIKDIAEFYSNVSGASVQLCFERYQINAQKAKHSHWFDSDV